MLSSCTRLTGINQSYYCHTATVRFRGPAGTNQTGLPGHMAPMETNPKNSNITKPQGTCYRLMKNDKAQNEEISINRQTVTFWCDSGGTAPGKVISELRLITACWEVSLSLTAVSLPWPLCNGNGKMTSRDKTGRREG